MSSSGTGVLDIVACVVPCVPCDAGGGNCVVTGACVVGIAGFIVSCLGCACSEKLFSCAGAVVVEVLKKEPMVSLSKVFFRSGGNSMRSAIIFVRVCFVPNFSKVSLSRRPSIKTKSLFCALSLANSAVFPMRLP